MDEESQIVSYVFILLPAVSGATVVDTQDLE